MLDLSEHDSRRSLIIFACSIDVGLKLVGVEYRLMSV
jgi:hypothetical protein